MIAMRMSIIYRMKYHNKKNSSITNNDYVQTRLFTAMNNNEWGI